MIHLVGIVFQGGIGIPLFTDINKYFKERQPDMIWGLITAMQTVAHSVLGEESKGLSEMKSGKVRFVMFDPFLDMTNSVKEKLNKESLDTYVIMAMQDLYDNLEVTVTKLREVHNVLIDNELGLDKSNASVGFMVPSQIKTKIKKIVLQTQDFPKERLSVIRNKITDFINKANFATLVISIADIDAGLVTSVTTSHLYEDPAFTELILSNIVAENPSDAKSVWIERKAPDWVSDYSVEAFIMEHIGTDSIIQEYPGENFVTSSSDFRLLARVCFSKETREEVRDSLKSLATQLDELIAIN